MPDHDWKTGGLDRHKYRLQNRRPTGEYLPVSDDAAYFTLRIDCDPETGEPYDPNARKALTGYANFVRATNPQLADDIAEWLHETRPATADYAHPIKFGDVMTIDEFVEWCRDGSFIDDDGFGHPMKGGQEAAVEVKPSRFQEIPKDATHICWYSR